MSGEVLKVAVLIDHRANHPGETGGLVGTWEQVSRIASGRSDLELSIFFLGDSPEVVYRGSNIRHFSLLPVLGTERFAFLKDIPTHTDLAPLHPFLYRRLREFHLYQTTDTFYAFAKTALWRSRIFGVPLVTAVQTDVIGWARIHTPIILDRILSGRAIAKWILRKYRYLDRQQRSMERRFGRYVRHCSAVFISHDRDRARIARLAPRTPVFFLRRGIDKEIFHPSRKNRARLCQKFNIPDERMLLLFVGRVDITKGALIAAKVVRGLLERGRNVHLILVGEGMQRQDVLQTLGNRVTLTGNFPHEDLGWIYASSDLLLFPSEHEVWPNVIMEARACGLPVMTCEKGARHIMEGNGKDGILLPDQKMDRWLNQAEVLLDHPDRLREMGRNARKSIEMHALSWNAVLEEDLLPVWLRAAKRTLP